MTNNGRIDETLMHPGIPTGVQGFDLLLNSFNGGTAEVKNMLLYECDVVTECKVCRNLFRSLPSFIAHKRSYCKDSAFEQSFPRPNTPPAKLASCSPDETNAKSLSDIDDANENFEIMFEKSSVEKNTTDPDTDSDNVGNASKLTFNFLSRLVKRVESSMTVPNAFYGPLHNYPENNRLVRHSRLENGVKAISNNNDLDQLSAKDKRNADEAITMVIPREAAHRQHGKELRNAEELKIFESLSPSEQLELTDEFVAHSKNHRTSTFSSNLREKRALKSPYGSEFVSSLPKRSKRSLNDISPSPIKKSPLNRHRPIPKRLPASNNNNKRRCSFGNSTSSSNFDKFPVIFSPKQKQESSAMMDMLHRRCKLCGASFTNKCNLERHCYMHLGYVRFKCSKCEVAAFFRTELRRHLRGLCQNLKRTESGTLTDDELNDLIIPICPEEPGKIMEWNKKTTWGNNFKGRANVVPRSSKRKSSVVHKNVEIKTESDDDTTEKIKQEINDSSDEIKEKKPEQGVKLLSGIDKLNESFEEKKAKLQNEVVEKKKTKSPSADKTKGSTEESKSTTPPKLSSMANKKIETVDDKKPNHTIKVSILPKTVSSNKVSSPLLKPIVKMFKGSDGKVWAQPFFPKN